jgi:hypothetical protein
MTTLRNTSGSKAVNITYNEFNGFRASYVQIYNGDEQVLQAKSFKTEKGAKKWANEKLA